MPLSKKIHISLFAVILISVVLFSTEVRADLFEDWGWVTGVPGPTVVNQLSVAVTDEGVGDNQVLFTFSNVGVVESSITDIYFDDGALFGIADVVNGPGVSMGYPTTPRDLPGGSSLYPPFQTSSVENGPPLPPHFSAGTGGPSDGVNPGESVGIVFDLLKKPDLTYYDLDDVIAAIHVGFRPDLYYSGVGAFDGWTQPNLRIGLHVQAIGDGVYSQTYILTPVPGAAILGLLGLGVAGLKLRRFA